MSFVSRFSALSAAVCLLALLATTPRRASASAAAGAGDRPPNVVLIVSDDHGYGDVGYHNPEVRTPNIDRLVSQGVRLERFYSYPICSLTRAALLTGLSTLRTGVNNRNGLALDVATMPERFREAGYQTWMCGKWHLGGPADNTRSGPEYFPTQRGFDHFYGFLNGAIDYTSHIRKDTGALDWQRDGKPVNEKGFSTDLLADEAIRRLRDRDQARPFLLYLAFNAVHGPLQAPPSGLTPYREIASRKRQVLVANVTYMDSAIGRVVKALDDEGLRENTIVIFFGDNGGQLSQGANNLPLRGEKGGVFEGGIRVPAAIRWPGVLPAGQTSRQVVWVADILPTLIAATGLKTANPSKLDGMTLWESLRSGRETPRDLLHGTTDLAFFHGDYKVIRPRGGESPMLFDIVKDPNETTDLAAQKPEILREMLARLNAQARALPTVKRERPAQEKAMKKKGGGEARKKAQRRPRPDDAQPKKP